MRDSKMASMWQYVLYTYLLFWVMVLGLGGLAALVFQAPPIVMEWVTVLCSWSPTIVLWLMLKRLKPGLTIRAFYKRAFQERLDIPLLLLIPLLVFGICLVSVALLAVLNRRPFDAQLVWPSALGNALLLTILQGASGEESGWRGYLRPELEGRYGFLAGNLLLGVIWTFWHAPLWFVSSNFGGAQLVLYIVANLIVLTALSVIMGVFMQRCNNLLIAFWVHFCLNFSFRFLADDVYFLVIFAVLYIVAALALLFLSRKRVSVMAAA